MNRWTRFLTLALIGISARSFGGTEALWAQGSVPYDIVYVRQPRYGDQTNTIWPEVFHPARAEPGADLVLLHPDGSEEILVACSSAAGGGGVCSVTDPFVSFDAEWVYYSLFYDLTATNYQRNHLPNLGADIFRIRLSDRAVEQLTHGEFTPNTGAGNWDESNPLNPSSEFNRLGYGILNLGASPLPGGKIVFTSNRNAYTPPQTFTAPTLQLFVMDEDGANVTPIAPMTIGSALHPVTLRDGRVMFTSYESQGLRDRRVWALWYIYPDGRRWGPLVSAFKNAAAFHFATQLSSEDLVITDYYNLNNNGFGAMYRFPVAPPTGTPAFHGAFAGDNPPIEKTKSFGLTSFRMPFTPWGMFSISPFTHGDDEAAPLGAGGARVGKVTHPSAAPGNDLLVAWTPGPANDLTRPTNVPRYDSGLYLIPNGDPIYDPANLVSIKNDPGFNEAWPRAVVTYESVHGVAEPAILPWLPNDGSLHSELPAGTPFGLVGTSSLYKRESFPAYGEPSFNGLDPFNTSENGASSNWGQQGAEAGRYSDDDIWAVRLLAMEPNTHRSYGPNIGRHFENFANERLRILGEIPLRKPDGTGGEILDLEGNPDTSFLVKIPADTPFTFQTLDRNGLVLNMAQTWHQVRPGEMRLDCGGCHAHSQQPLDFFTTEASSSSYPIHDLSTTTPILTASGGTDPDLTVLPSSVVDVEFHRDIRPILQAKCVTCHTQSDPTPPGNLVLDDLAMSGGLPGDYKRLADDSDADWGYPPVIPNGIWRQTNASRYIRKFQSRRSLLIWKVFGQRLDGWANADHPTETTPGDPATLPAGAAPNDADLDFTGTIMPPPSSGMSLTEDEKMTFGRWIDLGAPIDTDFGGPNEPFGWFLDDLRPTLEVSVPRAGFNAQPIDRLRFGLADANSGIDYPTFSVTADFPVEGRTPGAELADLAAATAQGIYELPLSAPIPEYSEAHLFVEVADTQGNFTQVDRKFATKPSYQLTIAKPGPWPGMVTSDVPGIACGASCAAHYPKDTVVQLTATPDYGGELASWSAECPAGQVTLTGDVTCTVTLQEAACVAPDDLILSDDTVLATKTHEACNSITAGPNYAIVGPGGDLTLRARQLVVLENGFSIMTDGEFRAEVDLMAGSPP